MMFAQDLDKWVAELEATGPLAPRSELETLLERAPDRQHPDAVWLVDYLNGETWTER